MEKISGHFRSFVHRLKYSVGSAQQGRFSHVKKDGVRKKEGSVGFLFLAPTGGKLLHFPSFRQFAAGSLPLYSNSSFPRIEIRCVRNKRQALRKQILHSSCLLFSCRESSPSKGFRLFGGGSSSNSNSSSNNAQQQQQQQQPNNSNNGVLRNSTYDADTLSRVGSRLASAAEAGGGGGTANGVASGGGGTLGRGASMQQQLNLSNDNIYTGDNRNHQMAQPQQQQQQHPPPPMPKPGVIGWRPQQPQQQKTNDEEAIIPSDSLYGGGGSANTARRDLNQTWHQETSFQQPQQQPPPTLRRPPPSASQNMPRPSLGSANLEHWSSHGYLSKPQVPQGMGSPAGAAPVADGVRSPNGTLGRNAAGGGDNGYVLLKRQGDQLVPMQPQSPGNGPQQQQQHQLLSQQQQPQSLPPRPFGQPFLGQQPPPQQHQPPFGEQPNMMPVESERKYFSVKGFSDLRSKHPQQQPNGFQQQQFNQQQQPDSSASKYYSVDARYNSVNGMGAGGQLPPDLKLKLRQVQEAHQQRQLQLQQQQLLQQQQQKLQQQQQQHFPYPQHQAPPPPPRPSTDSLPRQQSAPAVAATAKTSTAAAGGAATSSASWLEWTQQLQAYIAWVNSQLRKRPDLRPVQDLRTDLQSGEVLAQLIEIICK